MSIYEEERPLFATEQGGFVVYQDGGFFWHSGVPPHINAVVGDPVPDNLRRKPFNQAARDLLSRILN